MRLSVAIAGLLLVADACGPAVRTGRIMPPGVVIVGSRQGYPVEGRTAGEIAVSMRSEAARLGHGGFLGFHRYSLRWSYTTSAARGMCRAETVRVQIETVVQAPDWRRPPGADSTLVAQWEAFSSALEEHERGHERIAIEGAGQLARQLRDLQEMSCLSYRTNADREARRLNDAVAQRQVVFDESTRHGMNDGAIWPPRLARP